MPVPKDINYAEFAHDTYKPVNSRRKKIYHMILNENQSDLYHSVYANPMTKEMHLSIRGTDPTHLPDLSADIAIAKSKEMDNPRFMASLQKFRDLKNMEQYRDYKMSVSGHSLAGTIVSEIVGEHGVEGHAYNPGIRPYVTHIGESWYRDDPTKLIPNRQLMNKNRCRIEHITSHCKNQANNLHTYYVKSGAIVDPISETGRINDVSESGMFLYNNVKKTTTVEFNSAKAAHPHALENYL